MAMTIEIMQVATWLPCRFYLAPLIFPSFRLTTLFAQLGQM